MNEWVAAAEKSETAAVGHHRPEFQWLAAKPCRAPRYPSPLRYPGAKRNLIPHIANLLTSNNLKPDLFVEAFAGGASVSLALLWQHRVDAVGLVDLDPLVAAFWKVVFNDTNWLIDQVMSVPITLAKWEEVKRSTPTDLRGRALKCLYLNRTSFSGILNDRAGPIGGKAQNSPNGIGCRFNRANLADRIKEVASLRERVVFILEADWQLAVQWVVSRQAAGKLRTNVAYYFDPPFFDKAERLYRYCFREKDHLRLRDTLVTMNEPWILSYDRFDRVQELYDDFAGGPWSIGGHYSAAADTARRRATEALLTNLPVRPDQGVWSL